MEKPQGKIRESKGSWSNRKNQRGPQIAGKHVGEKSYPLGRWDKDKATAITISRHVNDS